MYSREAISAPLREFSSVIAVHRSGYFVETLAEDDRGGLDDDPEPEQTQFEILDSDS